MKAARRHLAFAAVIADHSNIFRDKEAVELNPPVLAYIVSQR